MDRSDLMLAYAKAHGALERLDDRWATSPIAGAWRARMAWTDVTGQRRLHQTTNAHFL